VRVYEYRAIVAKRVILRGTVSYTDNRSGIGFISMPLDSRCITGFVLGETEMLAQVAAIKELKQRYPEECGYVVPETCHVEECPETIVEVVG